MALGLTSCGGEQHQNEIHEPRALSQVPTSATALVELGPISGGNVEFQTINGATLSTGGINSDGSLNYNPQDIVSRMGNEQWLVIRASGGLDTDVDDDGVTDPVATPVHGSFRMLISRSSLER